MVRNPMLYNATRPRLWLAGAVALASVVVAAGAQLLRVETIGSPWGPSARIGATIATLIVRQEPYIPSLHRDPGKDRYRMSLLLHDAADPSVRRLVTLVREQPASVLNLSRIAGVANGRFLFQVPGDGAYVIDGGRLLGAAELHGAGADARAPRGMSMMDLATGERALLLMLSSACETDEHRLLALLTPAEAASGYRVGLSIPRDPTPDVLRGARQLYRGTIEREGTRRPLRSLDPLTDEIFHDAAFVRTARGGDALRLGEGLLMLYRSAPRGEGELVAARVDAAGNIAWRVPTGIGALLDVLPDPQRPAFVGTRPAVPDQVPEPILVVLDAAGGAPVTHSLWVRD
jgi:hypothetical protein